MFSPRLRGEMSPAPNSPLVELPQAPIFSPQRGRNWLSLRATASPIFSLPWGGDAVGRGGVRAPRRGYAHRRPAPAPPLCRCATSPPAGGRKNLTQRSRAFGIFSPPWGGRCRRQRGGCARRAEGMPTTLPRPPAPPLSLRDISPAGGRKFAHTARFGVRNFLPPLGEDAVGRGGVRAQCRGCAHHRPAPGRPPSVAARPLPPRGEKKISRSAVGRSEFSPPLGGEMP